MYPIGGTIAVPGGIGLRSLAVVYDAQSVAYAGFTEVSALVTQRTATLLNLMSLLNATSHPTGVLATLLTAGFGAEPACLSLVPSTAVRRSPLRAVLLTVETALRLFAAALAPISDEA